MRILAVLCNGQFWSNINSKWDLPRIAYRNIYKNSETGKNIIAINSLAQIKNKNINFSFSKKRMLVTRKSRIGKISHEKFFASLMRMCLIRTEVKKVTGFKLLSKQPDRTSFEWLTSLMQAPVIPDGYLNLEKILCFPPFIFFFEHAPGRWWAIRSAMIAQWIPGN